MVLEIYKTGDGHVPGIEYLPAGEDVAYTTGTPLAMEDNSLRREYGEPKYISMAEEAKDGVLPVVHVDKNAVYKGKIAPGENINIGDTVAIAEAGFELSPTTNIRVVGILEDGVLVHFE